MFPSNGLLFAAFVPFTYSFLMGGRGGEGGCSCNMPAVCAPSAIPACPPPPSCPCRAAARGEKTVVPAKGMDALELQATLMGLDLVNHQRPAIVVPKRSEVEELQRLGEDLSRSVAITPIDQSTNNNTSASEDLPDSTSNISPEIRFSPAKKIDEKLGAQEFSNATKSVKAVEKVAAMLSTTPLEVVRVDEESTTEATTAPTTTIKNSEVLGSDSVELSAVDGDVELTKCNSQVLKKLMIESITDNSNESKKAINAAAENYFGGHIDVVCSRGHFSYVYSSSLFCEASKSEVTCIAFRQST